MTATCAGCDRDLTTGATICAQCVRTLDVALANISAHHADLDTIEARRVRYGDQPGKASVGKTQPLPIDGRFADPTGRGSALRWETRNTVSTWARVCLDEWPPLTGPVCAACHHESCDETRRRRHPRDTVGSCCAYIAGQRHRIAGQPWAGQLLDELLDVEARLARMVDRPPDSWFAGTCGADLGPGPTCARPLYAVPGDPVVRCRDCGTDHDVETRRKLLLREAEGRDVTVAALARIMVALADDQMCAARLESRLTTWAHRGWLSPVSRTVVNGRPRQTYRVGEVLDLLVRERREGRARGA